MFNPSEETIHKITHSIIANQIALNKNEALKHTPLFKKDLKHKLNQLLPILIREEKSFDDFFNSVEEQTVQVYEIYEQYIEAVASVPIWDASEMTAVIQAFKADKKSVLGIAKKVLKNSGQEVKTLKEQP